jgi:NADPH:quinone reductase-like Zn-dependent oxidoreductase
MRVLYTYMKAALVRHSGETPVFVDFTDPVPGEGVVRVKVAASALSHITRGRASGAHYSSLGTFPFVPGIDGTGTLDDGTRVYFLMPEAPFGGMAEYCLVKAARCIPLPAALNDVTAAAIAIPGMSSWAAFVERAKLARGETVLVNGATGASGRLAVQIAKHLGAGKVIATGRDEATLKALHGVGADVTIGLTQDKQALETEFQNQFREGVGVVLDYLWGPSAELLLASAAKVAPDAVPIRFIEIGSVSAPSITLPSAVIRSTAIELMGSGIGSVSMPRVFDAIAKVLNAAVPAGLQIATKAVSLREIELHWAVREGRARTVFTPA